MNYPPTEHEFMQSFNATTSGLPDGSGYRFSRFRCKVWLEEDVPDDYLGWYRMAVTVTGRYAFTWLLI